MGTRVDQKTQDSQSNSPQGRRRDLGVQDPKEIETFNITSKTKPRPSPNSSRPRRYRDVQFWVRDETVPSPRHFSGRYFVLQKLLSYFICLCLFALANWQF